jgi:hypothetical protein
VSSGRSTAISAVRSEATNVAGRDAVPPAGVNVMFVPPSTTCAFVTMSPRSSKTIPVPAAVPFEMNGPLRAVTEAVIDSTPGSTFFRTAEMSRGRGFRVRFEVGSVVDVAVAALRGVGPSAASVNRSATKPPIPPDTNAKEAR